MALGITPIEIINKGTHPLLVKHTDWERIELSNIADVQNGYAFSSEFFNHKDGLPLIRIRDIFSEKTENYYSGDYNEDFLVNHRDILIGMDGDFKISRWPGQKGLLNQRVCRIKFYSSHYLESFLFVCVQPYLDAIHSETSAVTVKHLSSRTINDIPLPLPPLPIQRAIVSKIEALFSDLDNGIANFKKALVQLKIYRQAVLKKAFEGELTKNWRDKQTNLPTAEELLKQIKEDRQEHYNQQIEDWKKVVNEWEKIGKVGTKPSKPSPLKDFITRNLESKGLELSQKEFIWFPFGNLFSNTPQNGLYKHSSKYGSGTDIVRIDNFYAGVLNSSDGFKKVELEDDEIEKYKLENNQILINRVNSFEYLGKTGFVKNLNKPTVFESNIMKISVLKENVNPQYIVHFLTSGLGIKEIRKHAKHAVNQASINQTDVSLACIPLCSIQEQNQIVAEIESRLSVCDKVEQSITESIEKAEALRQSILKKAFEGKLLSEAEIELCKQEEDYEPASELLKKIKAEKLAKEPEKKKSTTKKKSKQ